jgi:hypothetical protein
MKNQTTKTRDSFIFYRSFFEAIQDLEERNQLEIFKAIAEYSLNDSDPKLTGISKTIFRLIEPQLLANKKRFINGQKGAEHGSKGGRPKKEKTPNKPLENPKLTPNKNNNVNVNVNLNKKCKSESKSKKQFKAPTLQEVQDYCKERNSCVDAKKFFDYYVAGDWEDAKGNQVKNWKQKLLTWESKTTNENRPESNTNQHTVDFINKMIGHSLITQIIISSPNKAQIWFNNANDFKKYQNLDIDLRSKVKEKITEELNITNFEPKF